MIDFFKSSDELLQALQGASSNSLDFILLSTGSGNPPLAWQEWVSYLDAAIPALKKGGILFIQGVPQTLAPLGAYLDGRLTFKYWIAIESAIQHREHGLPSAHAAVLMFVKGKAFSISRVRFPHQFCRACGKSLRDWGGKSHLMHPAGVAISDVWKDLPKEDNYTGLSDSALQVVLSIVSPSGRAEDAYSLNGIIGPQRLFFLQNVLDQIRQKYRVGYEKGHSRFINVKIDFAIPSLSDPLGDCNEFVFRKQPAVDKARRHVIC